MLRALVLILLIFSAVAFNAFPKLLIRKSIGPLMAEVEVIFPGNKKCNAQTGAPLKAVAAKAGFKPNYGCEVCKTSSHLTCRFLLIFVRLRRVNAGPAN
jgi:hypothetical protein